MENLEVDRSLLTWILILFWHDISDPENKDRMKGQTRKDILNQWIDSRIESDAGKVWLNIAKDEKYEDQENSES